MTLARCNTCVSWLRGPDMSGPVGCKVNGIYVAYGLCTDRKNQHGVYNPEIDDDGKPIPMLYTLRRVRPKSSLTKEELPFDNWPEYTAEDSTFSSREDFGCVNHKAK